MNHMRHIAQRISGATANGDIDIADDIAQQCVHVTGAAVWHEHGSKAQADGVAVDYDVDEFYVVPPDYTVIMARPDPRRPWRLEAHGLHIPETRSVLLHLPADQPAPYRLDTLLRAARVAAVAVEGLGMPEQRASAMVRTAIIDMERTDLHPTFLDDLLAGKVDAPFPTGAAIEQCRSYWPKAENLGSFAPKGAGSAPEAAGALQRAALRHGLLIMDDVADRMERRLQELQAAEHQADDEVEGVEP